MGGQDWTPGPGLVRGDGGGWVNDRGVFIGNPRCAVCRKPFNAHYGDDCDRVDPSRKYEPATAEGTHQP
jgi:hypothetical protein